MDRKEVWSFLRRRGRTALLVFAGIVGAFFVGRVTTGDPLHVAVSKVIIGPDPLVPRDNPLAFSLPPYMSFQSKLDSITHNRVLARAAQLALGELQFRSAIFQQEPFASRIVAGGERVRAVFGEDEASRMALMRDLSVTVNQIPRRQVVHIQVVASEPEVSLMGSWAIAEAAYQVHEERIWSGQEDTLDSLRESILEAEETVRETCEVWQASGGLEYASNHERHLLESVTAIDRQLVTNRMQRARLLKEIEYRRDDLGISPGEIDFSVLDSAIRGSWFADVTFYGRLVVESERTILTSEHPFLRHEERLLAALEREVERQKQLDETWQQLEMVQVLGDLRAQEQNLFADAVALKERKAEKLQGLDRFASLRRTVGPLEEKYVQAREVVANLRSFERQLSWFLLGQSAPVVVEDAATEAAAVRGQGLARAHLATVLALAIICAIGTAYALDAFDPRVRSAHGVAELIDARVVATVPKLPRQARDQATSAAGPFADRFHTAAIVCQRQLQEEGRRVVLITSGHRGEGRSTVAAQLAAALARRGSRTLLVDADLRQPGLHEHFTVPAEPGWATLLQGVARQRAQRVSGVEVQNRITDVEQLDVAGCVRPSGMERLDVLPAGPAMEAPSSILEVHAVADVGAALAKRYDYVIYDTPPLQEVGDALALTKTVDGAYLVVVRDASRNDEVKACAEMFRTARIALLGVVLTNHDGPEASGPVDAGEHVDGIHHDELAQAEWPGDSASTDRSPIWRREETR